MHFLHRKERVFRALGICLVCCFLQPLTLLASDHSEPAKEAPAGGHGDSAGGAAAGAKKVEEVPGWIEIEAQISSLEAKVQAKTHSIEELIKEKNHLKPNDSELARVVKEIGKDDRERRKFAEELEKQRTILHFRFPERGAAKNRKYHKVELNTVSEIESSLGIDGRLTRSVKKMRSQYGSDESAKKTPSRGAPGHSSGQEGTVILQK